MKMVMLVVASVPFASLLMLVPCLIADEDGDRRESKTIDALLPGGAKIYYVQNYLRNGKLMFRQKAIYECDVNGDNRLETLVVYSKRDEENDTEPLFVAILQSDDRDRRMLVQTFALPGTYYWTQNFNNVGAHFSDFDNDGKVEVFFCTAISASNGASLSLLYCKGDSKKDPYAILTATVSFHSIEATDKGFIVNYKDEKKGTTLAIKREKGGDIEFEIK